MLSEGSSPGLVGSVLHTSSQFCGETYHLGRLKLAIWGYLHHGNWQALQARAFFSPREPAVTHLPAHPWLATLFLFISWPGWLLLISTFQLRCHLFEETFYLKLSATLVTFSYIAHSFLQSTYFDLLRHCAFISCAGLLFTFLSRNSAFRDAERPAPRVGPGTYLVLKKDPSDE